MSMTHVAEQAGVSQATVSRVVNRSATVSEETQQKVEQAMREVGYSPPVSRRQRQRRTSAGGCPRTRRIAMLVEDSMLLRHGDFIIAMFRGVQQAADHEGITALMSTMGRGHTISQAVHHIDAEGALLIGFQSHPEIQRELKRLPAVWLTSHAAPGIDAVLPGNELVGCIAAEYLYDRKHTEVAFLCAELENASYGVRGDAFQREAESRGAHVQQFLPNERRSGFNQKSLEQVDTVVEELVKQLLASKPRPTGVFVPSDFMTAHVYRAMAKEGIAAGQDVQFVSCDNEATYLAGLWPRPATIDIAGETRGRRAVHELLWQIDHPQEQRAMQLTVEPQLIIHDEVDRP